MTRSSTRIRAAALLLVAACAMTGCAANGQSTDASPATSHDPWEPMNRKVFSFNMAVDKATLKPLAKGYQKVVPTFARRGITNFFDNLLTPRSAINNFLQGKPARGFNEIGRFIFNSTLGIGGLVDVADLGGMQRYEEDFSQTFAVWGLAEGPFVMLPLIGGRSMLETVALPLDFVSDLRRHIDDTAVRESLLALQLISLRATLLPADRFLEESNDPYITFREAYRQNREYAIFDGNPPLEDDYYEFTDDEFMDDEFTDGNSSQEQ